MRVGVGVVFDEEIFDFDKIIDVLYLLLIKIPLAPLMTLLVHDLKPG